MYTQKVYKEIYIKRVNKYINRGFGFAFLNKLTDNDAQYIRGRLEYNKDKDHLLIENNDNIIVDVVDEPMNNIQVKPYYKSIDIPYGQGITSNHIIDSLNQRKYTNPNYDLMVYTDLEKALLGQLIDYTWKDNILLIKEDIIRCYMCRTYIPHNKHLMCKECKELNDSKNEQSMDLTGQVALVTGGRVKVGYATALKLLRCRARVVITSRFPNDTYKRYS